VTFSTRLAAAGCEPLRLLIDYFNGHTLNALAKRAVLAQLLRKDFVQ